MIFLFYCRRILHSFETSEIAMPIGKKALLFEKAFEKQSFFICHILIKKMHGLRDSLVTSVGFSFHYFHVLRLDFALFVFER